MSAVLTSVIAALVESWQEFRLNRMRVMLSLFGVMAAVFALSGSIAFLQISTSASTEQNERAGGRPATLMLSASEHSAGGEILDFGEVAGTSDGTAASEWDDPVGEAWTAAAERYSVEYTSRILNNYATVQTLDGDVEAQLTAVDPDYREIHRLQISDGAWFSDSDTTRMVPAILVNDDLWEALGSPTLDGTSTARVSGLGGTTAVIIGKYGTSNWGSEESYEFMTLVDTLTESTMSEMQSSGGSPQYEAWVPEGISEDLAARLMSDVQSSLGTDWSVDVYRSDFGAMMDVSTDFATVLISTVGGVILLLGALSLLNIALVTVRQRVREIGVRRSVGATRWRIFTTVMLESVVATVLAGVAGVMLAVIVFRIPAVVEFAALGTSLDAVPAFPTSAALVGLISATVVGSLAGLIPASVAVKVKVIDALRY